MSKATSLLSVILLLSTPPQCLHIITFPINSMQFLWPTVLTQAYCFGILNSMLVRTCRRSQCY